MDDLHDHIQQTFAAFMGYDEYDQQLTIWCYRQKHAERERHQSPWVKLAKRRWQKRNRHILRAADRRWRQRLPADECWCRAKRVPGRKLCAEHLQRERLRAAANKTKRRAA